MAPTIVLAPSSMAIDSVADLANTEYEKILHLRDQIFAGTHPRLKLAIASENHVKIASNELHGALKSSLPNGIITLEEQRSEGDHLQTRNGSSLEKPSITSFSHQHASNGLLKPAMQGGISNLDPIFLTKSDELIRAEIRLERQRIERSLQQQVEERRKRSRQPQLEQEVWPEFDVSEVFLQAQELVKPLMTTVKPSHLDTASPHGSLDESTCYSSQVDEPTPEGRAGSGNKHRSKPCRYFFAGSCKKGVSCTYSHDPAFKRQLERIGKTDAPLEKSMGKNQDQNPGKGQEQRQDQKQEQRQEERQDQKRNQRQEQRQEQSQGKPRSQPECQSPQVLLDDRQGATLENGFVVDVEQNLAEPTYGSEPAYQRNRGQVGGKHHDPWNEDITYDSPGFRTTVREWNARPNEVLQPRAIARSPFGPSFPDIMAIDTGRTPPTPRDGRIVQNHITSPVAPQAARVSPLAVAKFPRMEQSKRDDDVLMEVDSGLSKSNGQSPGIYLSNPRKRRHDVDTADTARNVLPRRAPKSPPAYIKEEPLSPPPFSALPLQEYPRYEIDARRPLILRSPTPNSRERGLYQPVERAYIERASIRRASSPMVRTISRTGQRFEIREEPELRRVLSSQQLRRGTPPFQGHTIYSIPPTPSSHVPAYATQAEPERRPQWAPLPHLQPIPRSRIPQSPEVQQIRYAPIEREGRLMAPPPRRIVYDQSGAEYYEAAPPIHRSALPPSTQQSLSQRATIRPGHGTEYGYAPSVQRIVSPGPASPRYVEYASAPRPMRPLSRLASYEPREEVYRPVSSYDGRVDWRRASVRPQVESLNENARLVRKMPSPEPMRVQYVEYPAEPRMIRALSRAPILETRDEVYTLRGEPSYGTYLAASQDDLTRRGSVSRLENTRPVGISYDSQRQVSRIHPTQVEERSGTSLRMPLYARQEARPEVRQEVRQEIRHESQPNESFGRGFDQEHIRPQYEYAPRSGQA